MIVNTQLGVILGEYLRTRLGQELLQQGHRLTGELISSIEYKIQTTANGLTLDFFASEYGSFLNTGVPAARIPYTPGRRGGKSGGTSAYIQGLIRYVQRRMGLRGKEGISAAFAIARKHKKEGMPTAASYRFSSNSRRTGWVDIILEQNEQKINDIVQDWVGSELELLVSNFIQQKKAA
jgi:hypothetical protein